MRRAEDYKNCKQAGLNHQQCGEFIRQRSINRAITVLEFVEMVGIPSARVWLLEPRFLD
ncbi:hypothetical protein [Moraxella lacunata]|uniref:hypothetical protein n=1 Tax=Moraxella lacunata TaxID=477 RepID=UPI0015F1747F|nr:hypothetical protein [Moraxella lacunata]